MKSLFFLGIFLFTISFSEAQPCKKVKRGMTKSEVTKVIGPPDSEDLGGYGNGSDTLLFWRYGNQQVIFNSGTVDAVKSDLKKEEELAKKLAAGEIPPED